MAFVESIKRNEIENVHYLERRGFVYNPRSNTFDKSVYGHSIKISDQQIRYTEHYIFPGMVDRLLNQHEYPTVRVENTTAYPQDVSVMTGTFSVVVPQAPPVKQVIPKKDVDGLIAYYYNR